MLVVAPKPSMRGRAPAEAPYRLSLRRVVGTTCSSPTGFDTVLSSFAYIAGGAVVVVDVTGCDSSSSLAAVGRAPAQTYTQRFFRARPSAAPVYAVSPHQATAPAAVVSASAAGSASSAPPPSTPKTNDSRSRVPAVVAGFRDVLFGSADGASSDSPTGRTWTSRERIKAATCLSLSRDGRFLAVGETGYAPRVLVFSLRDGSSDMPLASISEHAYGVRAVAWSADTRYLASLGAANDGFIYVWRVDTRTGAARLFQQNRCTAAIRGMVWMGNSLITLGVRHVKAWRIDESFPTSPGGRPRAAQGQGGAGGAGAGGAGGGGGNSGGGVGGMDVSQQKPLPGRNIVLGSLLEATFTCAAVVDENRAIICTDAGDVCVLEDDKRPARLVNVLSLEFPISSVTIRDGTAFVGGRAGQFATLSVASVLGGGGGGGGNSPASAVLTRTEVCTGVIALGFLTDNLVTVDTSHSIDIWSPSYRPGQSQGDGGSDCNHDGAAAAAEQQTEEQQPAEQQQPAEEQQRQQQQQQSHIPLPGHGGEPIMGIQSLEQSFLTWSGSGRISVWDPDGRILSQFGVPVEQQSGNADADVIINQLTCVRATAADGRRLVVADKLGVLRIIDVASGECLLDTKAHTADCQSIAVYEDETRLLVASCGRDRTVQLFRGSGGGGGGYTSRCEHFQTVEFASRVMQVLLPSADRMLACALDRTIQVFDLVAKEGGGGLDATVAAIPSRVITLKAAPTSMAIGGAGRTVFVSLADRSVAQYDLATGRHVSSFRCTDEGGSEAVVLDCLSVVAQPAAGSRDRAGALIVGLSNMDKSIRIYDSQTGAFLDREWGHTEAINGVALLRGGGGGGDDGGDGRRRRIASVGSDGTIMLWTLDPVDTVTTPTTSAGGGATAAAAAAAEAVVRGPSPSEKDGASLSSLSSSSRQPVRRVLTKAELVELQRSGAGKRSPPRTLRQRSSRTNLTASLTRTPATPTPAPRTLPAAAGSPPESPTAVAARRRPRRPSLATLTTPSTAAMAATRKRSAPNLRAAAAATPTINTTPAVTPSFSTASSPSPSSSAGSTPCLHSGFGSSASLSAATEQTCQVLRAYRRRVAAAPLSESIGASVLAEFDLELSLTAAALGERAASGESKNNAMSETVLSGLLDIYSERLVSILNEKLGLGVCSRDSHSAVKPGPKPELEELQPGTNPAPESRGYDRSSAPAAAATVAVSL